jgi:hypothetical protein
MADTDRKAVRLDKKAKWMIYLFWGLNPTIKMLSILGIADIFPPGILGAMNYTLILYTMFQILLSKKVKLDMVIVSFMVMNMIGISFLFPENVKYILNRISDSSFLLAFIPAIYIYRFSGDPKKMLYWSYKVGLFSILINSISYFSALQQGTAGDSYMTYAYSIVFPWCFLVYQAFTRRNIVLYSISGVVAIVIMIYGSRGAVLCLAIFVLYALLLYTNNLKKRLTAITITIIFSLLLFLYHQQIIDFLILIAESLGYESRTIYVIRELGINYDSGRSLIYSTIWNNILKNPFTIRGIGADEVLNGSFGLYSHNVLLELMYSFGFIITLLLVTAYMKIGYEMILRKTDTAWKSLFAVFYIAGIPLNLLSGNILSSYNIIFAISLYYGYKIACRKKLIKVSFND